MFEPEIFGLYRISRMLQNLMDPEKGVNNQASGHHGLSREMIPIYPVFGVKKKSSGMVESAFHLSRYPETKIFDHLHIRLDAPAPGGEIISAHKGFINGFLILEDEKGVRHSILSGDVIPLNAIV